MKTVGKVLAAGALMLTGYFVGFYEMKYNMMKMLLEASIENDEEESQK